MTTRFLAHLRHQWMGAMALFLVLAGGVAYGANTVFSGDIVDGEVKTADIADDAVTSAKIRKDHVRSVDVADDTLSGGGLAAADLRSSSVESSELDSESVAASELVDTVFYKNVSESLDDAPGGPSEEVELAVFGNESYILIGRCTEGAGGAVTARVIAKSDTSILIADSDAPGGQADVTGIAPGGEITLASHGPTTASHWGAGDYMLSGGPGSSLRTLAGVVGVGTHATSTDCRFSFTGVG